jgi:glycerophosphoryl diester phosphodiesterase
MCALNLAGKSKPYLMAHRGNSACCPENTLAAFRQAVQDGADILETDLHLSADGEFVCIHDATLDRTTDGCGAVASLSLEQIQQFRANYGKPGFETERVPALRELLAILPADIALALELKTDRFLEPQICQRLVHELEQGGVRERTVALSFHLPRLEALHRAAPDIPTGLIIPKNPIPPRDTPLLGPLWPLLIANPLYVWWAHARGQVVCPLDTAPEARLRCYRALGCDAIMSNNPGVTRRALVKLSR